MITLDSNKKARGYVALYNSPSKPMLRGDGQSFIEVIKPGAFRDTLRDGHNIYALYSHDRDAVLGSTQAGTLIIREDATGLYVEITLPDTNTGKDLRTLLARGEPMGGSFCADIQDWKWDRGQDNTLLCELLSLTLKEVTITAFPAYPETSIVLRSTPPMNRTPTMETELENYRRRIRVLNL